jgi:signal transduction histidine kinase
MRARIADWLRENERWLAPEWIKLVRSRGGERDRQLTTRELERQFFTDFYHAFTLAVEENSEWRLAEVIERIAVTRVSEEFQLEETLDIFFLLKELIWERLAQAFSAGEALNWMHFLEPSFSSCLRVLGRSFTRASRSLLSQRLEEAEFMARRLAIANEEADRALSRLRILYNISRALSTTLDLKQISAAVTENLTSMPQIDRCAVWLTDKDVCELSVIVARGIDAEHLKGAYLPVDEERSAVTRAFKTRQLQLVRQVDPNEEFLAPLFPRRTLLVVPLFGEELPVGVMSADTLASDRLLETVVIELVQSVADQAGLAIHNTQLYEALVELNQNLDGLVQERTRELAKLNKDLAKLNRKKSDFIAIAAHELKTPLTLVKGYAEMLVEGYTQSTQSNEWEPLVSGIFKGAERLQGIVDDIVDVSLIDTEVLSLTLGEMSLAEILRFVYRDWSEHAKQRNQTIHVDDFTDVPRIQGDAQRLRQVFSNIVGNAIKYTPDNGRIEIASRVLKSEDEQPTFVEVVVSDTGVGINLEDRERIFDKFYRVESIDLHSSGKTKFMGAGPGLGLTIAKGIVEAHGGRIWVESSGYDPSQCPGSHFHVLLPIQAAWTDLSNIESVAEKEDEEYLPEPVMADVDQVQEGRDQE